MTKAQIAGELKQLGLAAGDLVLVHSSLSSLGCVEGGPEAVIDALIEVLGPEGTLLMPSFQRGGEHALLRQGCVFDLRTSPSEMGLITETFRRRPEVRRSISPTHCTAAWGGRAEEILAGHQYCSVSVGKGSPYHRVVEWGGKILFLGVTHTCNTTLHFVENTNGAPTICPELFRPMVIDLDGRCWVVPMYAHLPGPPRRYARVEDDLLSAGVQVNGPVGEATARLVDAQAMGEIIGGKIRKDPLYLIEVFRP